ncbi:MAG: prepilin-type N-terminal cleavage/methylation domain-containing protein [Deltaproteobacteria bacterium]|nr:prepilin-type N-terminal cleavage/methylation domain-containing protein [Deltaproteobacteria bacterium]
MSPRSARGFTLLEVMVAIFIMALVITFAFQAYQGIAEAYTRVSDGTSRDRAARILLDRIERELVGAVLVQRELGVDPLTHPYVFYGQPLQQSDSEGFELRFVTQTPLRSPGSPPAPLALVSYGTVASRSGHGVDLLRQEEALPAELRKEVEWTQPQTVADELAIFSMSFVGEGSEAPGVWDSTSVAQLDQLPLSIELRLALWEMGPDGEPWPGLEITRLVDLPVRPFRLSAEDAEKNRGAADCGSGVTVAVCLAGFEAELAAASPALAAAIEEARNQTEDACWSDPEPSPALQRLKVLLNGLPGFDEGSCP